MFSINMKLLPMKAHYFLYNAGTTPIVPFIPTLAKQLGFSSVVVGALYTALPVMGMIAKPTMGAIADRYNCQKALFLGFLLLTIVSFFPIMYVPSLPVETNVEFHCHQESVVKICGVNDCMIDQFITEGANNATIFCTMSCVLNSSFLQAACHNWNLTGMCNVEGGLGQPTLTILSDNHATMVPPPHQVTFDTLLSPYHTYPMQDTECMFTRVTRVEMGPVWHVPYCDTLQVAECRMKCQSETLSSLETLSDAEAVSHYEFWVFAALMVFSWIGMAVVVSVGDAVCYTAIGEQPDKYGHQRLWGSVGSGLFVVLAGWLVDTWSTGQVLKDYSPVFYLMAVMLALDIFASSQIQYEQKPLPTSSILHNVGKLLTDVQVVVFLLWLIFVGMCTAFVWNFLFWYLEELTESYGCSTTQQWIKTLEGLVYGVQSFGGELPFFFLSGGILKKIGHIHSMSLVLFAFGIRFLLYSTLTNPWWCLPIELLQGLTFGMFYATMTSYASLVAPAGTDNTVQGLVSAIFEGIGVSTGSFLAGLLFDQMSGAMVFRICGLAVLVVCVLHICVQFFLSRRHILHLSPGKGFNGGAHYASPNEAIHMLDEPSYEPLTPS